MHNIAPHRTTAAEALNPHHQLFKKVVLNSSNAIYYFRVKNGSDYQNASSRQMDDVTDAMTF